MSDKGFQRAIVKYVGLAPHPPAFAIEGAEGAARMSPCAKSKRGAVVYRRVSGTPDLEVAEETFGAGYNGPPWAYYGDDPDHELLCDGSEQCRSDCGRRCVHAEQRALDSVIDRLFPSQLRIVHVKIGENGKAVPGKGPSCAECAKAILDAGYGGIWLYQMGQIPRGPGAWADAVDFEWYRSSSQARGLIELPRWVYYPALAFYEATMTTCNLYQVRAKEPTP
jgi:deoxycytidylate deaminase